MLPLTFPAAELHLHDSWLLGAMVVCTWLLPWTLTCITAAALGDVKFWVPWHDITRGLADSKAGKISTKSKSSAGRGPWENPLLIPIDPSSQDGIIGSSQCAEFPSPNQQRVGDALLALEERPWNTALKLRVQQQLEDNTSCGLNSSSMKKLAEPVLLECALSGFKFQSGKFLQL